MFPYRLVFDSPFYLLLCALLPLLWLVGRRSLAGWRPWRRRLALAIRSLIVLLLVAALAEVQLERTSDGVAVLYLIDQSRSVPAEKTAGAIEYVRRSTRDGRDRNAANRAGVIVFGREAALETPPWEGEARLAGRFESTVDGDATNLAAALRLARAAFPPDAAGRVVILSDGNQTVGDALAVAQVLSNQGIGIDVMPLEQTPRCEVAVEKLTLPGEVREAAPFDARVVLATTLGKHGQSPIRGRLRVTRASGNRSTLLSDEAVVLKGGKQVFSFRDGLDAPDFYTYAARFTPDDAADDASSENNVATAFTHVRGRGQVLVIEDWNRPGRFDDYVACLERADLGVTVARSDQLFSNLVDLQRYDVVVLADVGRASGDASQKVTEFSDHQIEMLARNTQQLGCGLVILGGFDSFGAGAWANTALERAAPVDFRIKHAKVVPTGALVFVLDSSGSMTGEKLQMSKAAAIAAVETLGEQDHVGVVAFDSQAHWIVPLERVGSPENIRRRIATIGPGGGTDMRPALAQAYEALGHVNAAIKHVIVLTDGRTEGEGYASLASEARRMNITTSCVAVGKDSAVPLLNQIARSGQGKFYAVNNPRTIPRIFMKEAMRIARPLVFEDPHGIAPRVVLDHEMVRGIENPLPPITGFVMTTPKDNPLVEILLEAATPADPANVLLAAWQYGLGRSVALTTDVGQQWARSWSDWNGRDKLFTQMVRWAMRPLDEEAPLAVFAEVDDGVIRVVVTALDQEDRFVNFLELNAAVVGPGMEPLDLRLAQVAPGRYVGQLPARQPGTYLMSVGSPSGRSTVRSGVNVPYSAEFLPRATNMPFLRDLAGLVPKGGQPGAIIAEPKDSASLDDALRVNVFRRDLRRATSRQDAWHLLVFAAACLFFCDVFHRRVAVGFAWVHPALDRLGGYFRRRSGEPGLNPSLERLRSRKNQVDQRLDRRRARARCAQEPPGTLVEIARVEPAGESDFPRLPAAEKHLLADRPEEVDYTARLLQVKRQVRAERKSPRDDPS